MDFSEEELKHKIDEFIIAIKSKDIFYFAKIKEIDSKKYEEFEKKIASQYPAVFLFSPNYVLITNKKIKGIEITATTNPALHLSQIENWYKNTKREKK